jgi:putative ABC transport system ATP-binding protein
MLRIESVSKKYRKGDHQVVALDNVSLEVKAGEFVVVRGPSGCGKSTLLLASGALLAPDEGRVEIDGRDPYGLDSEERAALRGAAVGFVFQQFHLIPYLTVLENAMTPSLAVAAVDARTRAQELIEPFGLADRADHVPSELSTGERQRAALARALLNRPRLLLADEPTGNLDPDNAAIVLDHIAEFARSGGAVLMVTHDDVASDHADRVVRLDQGRIV